MNGQFPIDLAQALSSAPTAILEHMLIGMRQGELRDYHEIIDEDYIAHGFRSVHFEKRGATQSTFLQRGSDRVRIVSWHESRALQCWAVQTEEEYRSVVARIRDFSYGFTYEGGSHHVDEGHPIYLASRYVHGRSSELCECIWRRKQVFPDLWTSSGVRSSSKVEGNGEEDKGEERDYPILFH